MLTDEGNMMDALMAQYQNVPMDAADASLVAVAQSRSLRRLFTIDSDFYISPRGRFRAGGRSLRRACSYPTESNCADANSNTVLANAFGRFAKVPPVFNYYLARGTLLWS